MERRLVDGSVGMSIDRADDGRFRIWAPRHGCYVLSPDGGEIFGATPAGPAWRWERLVLAQALPLAAVLQGLEVFHASAVALDGSVVAFAGRSGAGKTSTALHVVRGGARLVTDDVLAVEVRDGRPYAYPGSTTARIDPAQWRRLRPAERRGLGRVVARGEKQHVALPAEVSPRPLRAIYHLVRPAPVDGEIRVRRIEQPTPPVVLRNVFLTYLRDRRRLVTQFDVVAAVLRHTALLRVEVPVGVDVPDVAERLLTHASAL